MTRSPASTTQRFSPPIKPGGISSRASDKLKKHIYDYAILDSDIERRFVMDLDNSSEVIVYATLPRGFLIPMPVGDYNPDWAISFKEGSVKYIYFVAETKGSMSSLKFREIGRQRLRAQRNFSTRLENVSLRTA
jgi:type III restriction enzyme